ncbi:MAG: dTMP kinase [Chloroflexi bacterium]|nr:dTMP kinase [Chloroflexota bacterium]
MAEGKFITLEGLDGSGLTTQAGLLYDWVRGKIPFQVTKEPTPGAVGSLIRRALQGEVALDEETIALLFAADRLDHLTQEIEPWLKQGINVLCDRYRLSSYAYQSVDLPGEWVRTINSRARRPDLTIVLQVSPAVCVERMSRSRPGVERYETEARLSKVWANYEKIIPTLQADGEKIHILDGERGIEEVQSDLRQLVGPLLGLV